jgi:hypothetical protein
MRDKAGAGGWAAQKWRRELGSSWLLRARPAVGAGRIEELDEE